MLNFKRIQLEDKSVIDRFLQGNTHRASELCFSNLYGWAHKFDTQYAVFNDFLLIKFKREDGGCSYLKPIGKGNLAEAVHALVEDCGCKIKFNMSGVTQAMWEELHAAMPGELEFELTRGNFDYIYTSEKLIGLKGKKLQSKRNHINRFKNENSDWQYISLNNNPEYLEECKQMLSAWMEANKESHDSSIELDFITTSLFLNNFEYLGLVGGAIIVNGLMQAFTLGTRLTLDTLIVHVEKALTDVHGAYTIINQQFAEHEGAMYSYINREEDMELESLRQAKMSYKPDILLEKGVVRLKHS